MRFDGHKLIHFIGIGGCSMNGLARILHSRGFNVQGSDVTESPFTEGLRALGIPVFIGQRAENLGEADLVVYSAAIKPDNPERAAASNRGIAQVERSTALGMLSEGYGEVVGIAGCHGKTTITSMLALIAEHCDRGEEHAQAMNATIHVGGFVDFLNGGVRIGAHDLFITEACEYVESFLELRPTTALISNIDNDHLDYYGDIEHITAAFEKYAALIPDGGVLIGCADDKRVKKLLDASAARLRVYSYGISDADYTPESISYDAMGNPAFDVIFRSENLGRIALGVPGDHNIMNALGAAAVALSLNAPFGAIASALGEYRLTRRRFELFGEKNGVKVFHDYAHHPSEIRAVLNGAKRYPHKKLFCVFQCNSYTRAKTLFTGDMSCMSGADIVLVPDIYPGREKDTGLVHARDMVKAINDSGIAAKYLPTFEQIRDYIDENAEPGDMVLTLGSGDVYVQTRKLL